MLRSLLFFKVRHLRSTLVFCCFVFFNDYRKYNFEKAETSWEVGDRRQQLGVLHFKSLWGTEFEMITKCQVLKLVFKMLVNIIYVFNFVK